ncbi:MAG: DNA polymerase III subunit delta' [Candidatus Hydrogenedentota bacterium]
MSFEAIRDQEVPVRLLRTMIQRKRIPNGLLFWGPSGVGKSLAAYELAKAVNCVERSDTACDVCLSCRKMDHGNHPDVKTLAPMKKSRVIPVETVEEVNELATLHPHESSWRVFIFQEADRMNWVAQNHFLKTLEEPPGQSLFILVTEFPRVLLPTIRSRCQLVRFGSLRAETIVSLLREQRDAPEETARALAAVAQGQMSRALDLLESEKREVMLSVAEQIGDGKSPNELAESFMKRLEDLKKQVVSHVKANFQDEGSAEELTPEDRKHAEQREEAMVDALMRQEVLEHLYILETWYRDVLVYGATGEAKRVFNQDQMARLEAQPSIADTERKIEAVERARSHLNRFINEERVFRDLFFTLAEH